jgi:hemerythrin superfamily protein
MNAKLKVLSEKPAKPFEVTAKDPFELLMKDHKHVKKNFEDFESADDEEKYSIFVDTVLALVVHTKIEEELIYPLLTENEDEEDMKNEAAEEHRVVDFIITEMKGMDQDDEKFDAKFKVLSEMVKHHIKKEESEMFPTLRKMDIDLEELMEKVLDLQAELNEEYADLDAVEPLKSPVTTAAAKTPGRAKAKTTKAKTTKAKTAKAKTAKAKTGTAKKASAKTSKSSSNAKSKISPSKKAAPKAAKKTVAKKASAKTASAKTKTTSASSKKKPASSKRAK